MPPATETAVLYLKPDLNIDDSASPDAKQLRKCLDIVASQKGFQRQYYGRQVEDPSLFIWSIDWDDVSDHHDFMKSDSYKEFFSEVTPIFDLDRGAPALTHANYASHPPDGPRNAPVTEFACFALPASASNEQKSALEDAVLNAATTLTGLGSCTSFATGWIIEELDNEKGTDGKAIVLSALLGWRSREAHMETAKSQEFLDVIGPIRGMVLPPTPGYKGTAMYHADLVKA